MIRIDLGKDELQKTPAKAKAFNFNSAVIKRVLKAKLTPKKRAPSARSAVSADIPGALLIFIGVALAFLPHLFFSQYRSFIVAQSQSRLKTLKEKTEVVNQEVVKLQPFQKELESYEQQKKLVKERLGVVRELLTSRGTPVNVLDALGQSLPERTWISKLELGLDGAKAKLKVNGESYSNEDISDFVDKLSESVYFNEVVLDEVTPGKQEGKVEVRSFSVRAKPKVKLLASAKAESPVTPPATARGIATAPRPIPGAPLREPAEK